MVRPALKGADAAAADEAALVTSEAPPRLGLLWQSGVVEHGGQRYVVRVVQKGTRLKSPAMPLIDTVEEGIVLIALFLPLRALSLLLIGPRYKVGVLRLRASDAEDVVYKERIRGEAPARSRGREVLSDLAQGRDPFT